MPVLQGGAYQASYTAAAALQGSAVVLTVTAPDGTITTPAVSIAGATATCQIAGTQLGSYLLVWTVTGQLVDALQDQFTVQAAALDLIDLVDLKSELNITGTSKDAKLRRWIDAATHVVEHITGPIRQQARVDVFDGETTAVVLPYRWVSAITLITETRGITNYVLTEQPLGQSIDAFGYTWDRTVNKIVRRGYGGGVTLFPPGEQVVTVKYSLGLSTLPADIQLGMAELIRHWYQRSEVGLGNTKVGWPGAETDDTGDTVVANYLVPRAALELLQPWRRRPGIF